jgi:hypothetical protein
MLIIVKACEVRRTRDMGQVVPKSANLTNSALLLCLLRAVPCRPKSISQLPTTRKSDRGSRKLKELGDQDSLNSKNTVFLDWDLRWLLLPVRHAEGQGDRSSMYSNSYWA